MKRTYKLDSPKSSSSKYIRMQLRERGMWCQVCRMIWYSHIHHIDKNRKNNDLSNLLLVCRKCHTALDRGKAILISTASNKPV